MTMANHKSDVEYYKAAMQKCKEKRESLGWTQERVAKQISDGYTKETYNRYESKGNNNTPRPGIFTSILAILNIDRTELDDELQRQGFSIPVLASPSTEDSLPVDNAVQSLDELREEAREEVGIGAVETGRTVIKKRRSGLLIALLSISLFLTALAAIYETSQKKRVTRHVSDQFINIPATANEQEEIGDIVRNAEIYESLGIYTDPRSFHKGELDKYWIPDGSAAQSIEKRVKRLLHHKKGPWSYGKASCLITFEIRSVTLNSSGNTAKVNTVETWFLPTNNSQGQEVMKKNPFFPASPIHYLLRKVGGRWLIQSDSTAYDH